MSECEEHRWQTHPWGDLKVDREPIKCFAQKATKTCDVCGLKSQLCREVYHLGTSEWMECDQATAEWIDSLPLL